MIIVYTSWKKKKWVWYFCSYIWTISLYPTWNIFWMDDSKRYWRNQNAWKNKSNLKHTP